MLEKIRYYIGFLNSPFSIIFAVPLYNELQLLVPFLEEKSAEGEAGSTPPRLLSNQEPHFSGSFFFLN
jgi:hypothetical protein